MFLRRGDLARFAPEAQGTGRQRGENDSDPIFAAGR